MVLAPVGEAGWATRELAGEADPAWVEGLWEGQQARPAVRMISWQPLG